MILLSKVLFGYIYMGPNVEHLSCFQYFPFIINIEINYTLLIIYLK